MALTNSLPLYGSPNPTNSSSVNNDTLQQSGSNLTNLFTNLIPENVLCNSLNFTNYDNQTLFGNETLKLNAYPMLANMTMCELPQIIFGNLTGDSQMPLANAEANNTVFGLDNKTPVFRLDYLFSVTVQVITLLFLIAMTYPLFQLSKKRSVLVLLIIQQDSRFCVRDGSSLMFIFLFFLPDNIFIITNIFGAVYKVQILATQLHLLALAANRTMAVFFPIWYSSNVRGKFLWKLCIFIWTIIIVLYTIFVLLAQFLIYNYLSPICVYFSALLYLLMSAKLIYLKCIKQNISNQPELDHVKISVICMLGMVPFLVENLPEIIGGTKFYAANIGWFYLSSTISGYFTYITEDLCLLLLCRDFRQMFIPTRCLRLPKPASNAVGINGNVVVPAAQMVGNKINVMNRLSL